MRARSKRLGPGHRHVERPVLKSHVPCNRASCSSERGAGERAERVPSRGAFVGLHRRLSFVDKHVEGVTTSSQTSRRTSKLRFAAGSSANGAAREGDRAYRASYLIDSPLPSHAARASLRVGELPCTLGIVQHVDKPDPSHAPPASSARPARSHFGVLPSDVLARLVLEAEAGSDVHLRASEERERRSQPSSERRLRRARARGRGGGRTACSSWNSSLAA